MSQTSGAQDRRGLVPVLIFGACLFVVGVVGSTRCWLRQNTSFLGGSAFIGVAGLTIFLTYENISRPPSNNLARHLAEIQRERDALKADEATPNESISNDKTSTGRYKTLICVGDSITHGRCSANFVDLLSNVLQSKRAWKVVNAGQNSMCTWTIRNERVAPTIACHPDFVCILIGTNDIKGIYNRVWGDESVRLWSLPEPLSFDSFERNLNGIVDSLLTGTTKTKVGLCTLPPMGEDLTCKANDFVRKANDIIERTARKHQESQRVTLLHVYNGLARKIEEKRIKNGRNTFCSVDFFILIFAIMCPAHVLFGISWNVLSMLFGNTVMSDCLHLNEEGANVVSKAVAEWIMMYDT